MRRSKALRFGIPSLDELFCKRSDEQGRHPESGILLPDSGSTSSVCIIGPDGTGKSILGMHLASHYVEDCHNPSSNQHPKVFYVSTDLRYEVAKKIWENFCLDLPGKREIPFTVERKNSGPKLEVALVSCLPTTNSNKRSLSENGAPLSNVLAENRRKDQEKDQVYFIDLASTSAGDDWGFINRILSVLEAPKENQPHHLMIIDSVEGFETLVGDRDAFGKKQPRRSRIAQIMRSASSKCHMAFIIEESKEGEHLPEEFVTDAVIRLRSTLVRDYVRRTVEIEKTRGLSTVRGQHHYFIRSGRGSTTGEQENVDDPKVIRPPKDAKPDSTQRPQSYIHVCHSLHKFSRDVMYSQPRPQEYKDGSGNTNQKYAAFGIPYLDDMLDGSNELVDRENGDDKRGLPCSTITALIGNSETKKGPLGRAFLSRCFSDYIGRFLKLTEPGALAYRLVEKADFSGDCARWIQNNRDKFSAIWDEEPSEYAIERWGCNLSRIFEAIDKANNKTITREMAAEEAKRVKAAVLKLGPPVSSKDGIPVLLATSDINASVLADKFIKWLSENNSELRKKIQDSPHRKAALKVLLEGFTICRRLEIHDLPSALLIHIVQKAIKEAQRILISNKDKLKESEDRYDRSWGIRVVIDDFSVLKTTYPEIRDDPLFQPFLTFYLGREGVTTLIIDTQPGRPDITIANPMDSELRTLVHHRLYTWRFPFYGENRVAIAAIPPISSSLPAVVRELRAKADPDSLGISAPVVDPHFELYSGIEEGNPQHIPLQVRLFEDTPAFGKYIEQEDAKYQEIFTPLGSGNRKDDQSVIVGIPPQHYERFRDFCYLHSDMRLDYSLVVQVDEFWRMRKPKPRRAGGYRPQWNYLNTITTPGPEPDLAADPFMVFQDTVKDAKARLSNQKSKQRLDRDKKSRPPNQEPRRRRDHFEYPGYELKAKNKEDQELIDRIPFTWDFGFLLCRYQAWEEFKSTKIDVWDDSFEYYNKDGGKKNRKKNDPKGSIAVEDIWKKMLKALNKPKQDGADNRKPDSLLQDGSRPSWRHFLGACKALAREQSYKTSTPVKAFELGVFSAQGLPCLVLEIWASEILETLKRKGEKLNNNKPAEWFLDCVSKRAWPTKDQKYEDHLGLIDLLKDYDLELYKAWLLLGEVLDISELAKEIRTGVSQSKDKAPFAIAARHWYKTASHFSDNFSPVDPVIPVGLPGYFSARGDWHLAVAGGSRSGRLADRALDLLSSRRANITRLEMGVGLPTRKLHYEKFHTCLLTINEKKESSQTTSRSKDKSPLTSELESRARRVPYEDILRLGASDKEAEKFYWLWRSGLRGYYRQARIWRAWLLDIILFWDTKRALFRDQAWISGFKRYDEISEKQKIEEQKNMENMEKKEQLSDWMKKIKKLEKTDNEKYQEELQRLLKELDPKLLKSNKKYPLDVPWHHFRDRCESLREQLEEASLLWTYSKKSQ